MKLKDFFDKIYIINLPERVDRRRGMERELKSIGLDYSSEKVEIFSAIKPAEKLAYPNIGVLGCSMSHLEVLRIAQREGLKNVLMMEDDLAISSRFLKLEEELVNELINVNWDMVFLGYFPYHGLNFSDYYDESKGEFVSDYKLLKKTHYPTQGAHFYAVKNTAYERLIGFFENFIDQRSKSFFYEQYGDYKDLDGAYPDTAYCIFRFKNPDLEVLITKYSLGWQRSSKSDLTPATIFDNIAFVKPFLDVFRNLKYRVKKIIKSVNPDSFH